MILARATTRSAAARSAPLPGSSRSRGPAVARPRGPLASLKATAPHRRPTTTTMAASTSTPADLASLPGVAPERPEETRGFVFQQTMLRVRDPGPSLAFYTGALGMTLVLKLDFPDMAFSLFFLAFVDDPSQIPSDPKARAAWVFRQPAVLELTHNHGTETEDASFAGYKSGNEAECKGFGHIGLSVPDVGAACERFEKLGVAFVKRPDDGKMKGLAFIKDPDGYWIEILNADTTAQYAR